MHEHPGIPEEQLRVCLQEQYDRREPTANCCDFNPGSQAGFLWL